MLTDSGRRLGSVVVCPESPPPSVRVRQAQGSEKSTSHRYDERATSSLSGQTHPLLESARPASAVLVGRNRDPGSSSGYRV